MSSAPAPSADSKQNAVGKPSTSDTAELSKPAETESAHAAAVEAETPVAEAEALTAAAQAGSAASSGYSGN